MLVIEVQSKGEKFTGEKERVYAGTERLIAALRTRRDDLQNDPNAYVFGTASGFRQDDFEWHRLFKLAGLDFGRDKGLVWHSLRHEFCSRTAENTGDPVIAQELARHKDLRTTQGYLHARKEPGPRRCGLAQPAATDRVRSCALRTLAAPAQVARRTETGEAPAWQGAASQNIGHI